MFSSSESEEEQLSQENDSDVSMEVTPTGVPVEQERNPLIEETMEDSGFQNDLNISGIMIYEEPRPESKDTLPTGEDDKVEARRHRNVHGTYFTRHFLVPEDYLFRETSLPEELIMPRPPGEVTEDPEHGKLHFGVFGQLTSVATCYKQKENWNGYHFYMVITRSGVSLQV